MQRLNHFCLLIALLFLSTSCSSTKAFQKAIKADDIQIPIDFGKKEGTMLVLTKGKKGYDRYFEKHFKENYTGKYIFIVEGEEKLSQYKDVIKYPYIFGLEVVQRIEHDPTPHGRDEAFYFAKFFVRDRQADKVYKTKKGSGKYAEYMKVYIQVLEETRLKNINN